MRIPSYKLWSHEAYGPCVSDDPTGMSPAEMPYDFASPEIVVTYLGYMRVVYSVSTALLYAGPYGIQIFVWSPYWVHTMTFKTCKCPNGSRIKCAYTVKKSVDFMVECLATSCQSISHYFYGRLLVEHF